MDIISLHSCCSTNDTLKKKYFDKDLNASTLLYTFRQTQGRGQDDKKWLSSPLKNITCSLYKVFDLPTNEVFSINFWTALLVAEFLGHYVSDKNIFVKWPNDIFINNHKVAGILIENFMRENKIHSIIGIGINVNQSDFGAIKYKATSLGLEKKKTYDIDEVMFAFIGFVEKKIKAFDYNRIKDYYQSYQNRLYLRGENQGFINKEGCPFGAKIIGTDYQGNIILEHPNGQRQKYNSSNIRFDYNFKNI